MKTLKKTLCLVLAVVMVVGVLILPASAADTTAKVEYDEEAIELLKGMKILLGKDGGELDLDSNVKRAEAATFMARLVATPAFMEKFSSKSIPFADCEDVDWAKTYIAYCHAQGIISGTSATTFEPDRAVTGHEMAKMLLCAMGYKADKEGFFTDAFQANVEILAHKAGISEGIDDLSKPLTRGQVVTMIYNTLFAGTVTYSPTTGEATAVDKTTTLYSETFDGEIVYGLVTGNKQTGAEKTMLAEITSEITADPLMFANDSTGYDFETSLDEVGHVMKVYTDGTKVYLSEDVSKSVTVTEDVTDELATKVGKKMTKGYLVENYVATFKPSTEWDALNIGEAGTYVVFNGKIVAKVNPITYTLDKVTAVAADKITLSSVPDGLSNKADDDKVVEYDGIAANDIVFVSHAGDLTVLTKAVPKVGNPTKITDGTKLDIGGETYSHNATVTNNSGLVNLTTFDFSKTYELYIVPNTKEYVVAVEKVDDSGSDEPASTLVYAVYGYSITETPDETTDKWGETTQGAPVTTYFIQTVNTSAQEQIFQVTEAMYKTVLEETSTASAHKELSKLWNVTTAYNATDKVTYATFTAPADPAEQTDATETAATAVKIKDYYYYDTDVTFIYVSGTKDDLKPTSKKGVQALTADQATKVHYVGTAVTGTSNFTVKYVFVGAAESSGSTSTAGTKVMYLKGIADRVKVPYTTADGETANGYEFTAFIDGVQTTIVVAENTQNQPDITGVSADGFVTYTTTTDGVYQITGENTDTTKLVKNEAIMNLFGDLLTVSGHPDLSTKGAVIVNLTTATITTAADLKVGDTVSLVLGENDTIVTIFVHTAPRT